MKQYSNTLPRGECKQYLQCVSFMRYRCGSSTGRIITNLWTDLLISTSYCPEYDAPGDWCLYRELCCRSWICDSHLGKLQLTSQGWWNRFSWSFIQQVWNFKYNWGSENLKTFVAVQMLIFLFTSPMKASLEPFSMERLQICSLRNRYLPLGRKCGFFCQF